MQITQTKKDNLKHEFVVKMTAQEIDEKINQALQEISKTVKMPGFRPGKIPMNLLKSKYGKAVMGDVLETAVNESTLKAINENNLRPAMRPKIEVKTFDEKSGLEYIMEIEILPEIKVMDMAGIKLEKMVAKPEKKAVTETLEKIAKSNQESEIVEEKRAAKKGDILVIDFDGTVDGKPFPGMKGGDFALELGSKSFVDTFEDQLVGAKVGDSKTVKVTFPTDYAHDKLRGVEAVFKVDVKELRTPKAPKLDDEFAKKIGFETLAKIEEVIEKQMQGEYDQLSRLNLKRGLLDILDEKHKFDVPVGMVEAEFHGILHQMMGEQGHDANHVHGPDCEHEHGTPEEREELKVIAERRVRLGLVLAEIGRQNKIEVTNQELQQAVINEARRYPGQEKQVFDFYQKNPQALEGVKAPIYEEKVVDFILAKSTVTTKDVSVDELNKASEAEDDSTAGKSKKKTSSKSKK